MAEEKVAPRRDGIEGRSEQEELAAIPLLEERLVVRKRAVESGRVSVHVEVDEREETVSEQLCREELHIERVPRNEQLTEAPHVRLEGNTTIIPVVEEVLVVEKRLLLVEEVYVTRRSTLETSEIPVKLRSERATVRRSPEGESGSRSN